MEYVLRNGKKVVIRKPQVCDAESIINILSVADTETLFLARNPGEFTTSIEKEKNVIQNVLQDSDVEWYIAELDGKIVGQCSVGLVRTTSRYRHRAEVAFVILKDYCNFGIGGKMMEECIKWCKDMGATQIELDVVKEYERTSIYGFYNECSLLGTIVIRSYDKYKAEIIGITVKHTYQNMHIGSQLIDYAIKNDSILELFVETDDDSILFYERYGFQTKAFNKIYENTQIK